MKRKTTFGRGLPFILTAPVLLIALPGLLGLQGCQTAKSAKAPSAPAGPIFFPPPPEVPRVQYLGSISSPQDLPSQRSKFADFILGPEPVSNVLVKPNNALLVGNLLYVCDTKLNTVMVYDLASGEARPLLGDGAMGKIKEPNNIARDDQGNFYVADKLRQAVLVYGPDEQFLHAWGRPGETEPVDVAIGRQALYVCNFKLHRIELWNRQSGALIKAFGERGIAPGQFYMPTHVALDADENIYVTDTGNFRVQKLSSSGKPLMQFGGNGDTLGKFALPKGLGLDGRGNLFVADSRFFNVQIFDPQGHLLLFFGGPGRDAGSLDLPSGVRVQPWPASVGWLNSRLAPGFEPESLVLVVSQEGEGLVNFFAVARVAPKTP